MQEFKAKILELLKKDEEFRYAVARLIGEEILKRPDGNEKGLVKLWEDMNRGFESMERVLSYAVKGYIAFPSLRAL